MVEEVNNMLKELSKYLKKHELDKIAWPLANADDNADISKGKAIRGDLGLMVASDGVEVWFEQGKRVLSSDDFPVLYQYRANMFATLFKRWLSTNQKIKHAKGSSKK